MKGDRFNVRTMSRRATTWAKPEEENPLSSYEVQFCSSAQHRPSGKWSTIYAATTLDAVTIYARMQDNDFDNLSHGSKQVLLVRSSEGPVISRIIEKYEVRREYTAEVIA